MGVCTRVRRCAFVCVSATRVVAIARGACACARVGMRARHNNSSNPTPNPTPDLTKVGVRAYNGEVARPDTHVGEGPALREGGCQWTHVVGPLNPCSFHATHGVSSSNPTPAPRRSGCYGLPREAVQAASMLSSSFFDLWHAHSNLALPGARERGVWGVQSSR